MCRDGKHHSMFVAQRCFVLLASLLHPLQERKPVMELVWAARARVLAEAQPDAADTGFRQPAHVVRRLRQQLSKHLESRPGLSITLVDVRAPAEYGRAVSGRLNVLLNFFEQLRLLSKQTFMQAVQGEQQSYRLFQVLQDCQQIMRDWTAIYRALKTAFPEQCTLCARREVSCPPAWARLMLRQKGLLHAPTTTSKAVPRRPGSSRIGLWAGRFSRPRPALKMRGVLLPVLRLAGRKVAWRFSRPLFAPPCESASEPPRTARKVRLQEQPSEVVNLADAVQVAFFLQSERSWLTAWSLCAAHFASRWQVLGVWALFETHRRPLPSSPLGLDAVDAAVLALLLQARPRLQGRVERQWLLRSARALRRSSRLVGAAAGHAAGRRAMGVLCRRVPSFDRTRRAGRGRGSLRGEHAESRRASLPV